MSEFEEIKRKKDEEASQIWKGISPKDMMCRTCKNAYKDTQFTVGAEKSNCEVFEPPYDKPMEILWKGAFCRYYVKKEA